MTLILLLLPADDADDVTQITTTLSFTSETNVDCILFNITKDDVVESPETFTVAVGRSFSTILILDNDGTGMYDSGNVNKTTYRIPSIKNRGFYFLSD